MSVAARVEPGDDIHDAVFKHRITVDMVVIRRRELRFLLAAGVISEALWRELDEGYAEQMKMLRYGALQLHALLRRKD